MNDFVQDGSPSVTSTEASASDVSQVSQTETSGQDVSAPASSAEGQSKEDLLSHVLKTVGEQSADASEPGENASREDAPASTEPQSENTGETAENDVDLDSDPSEEELSRYHSKTRKRIQKLLSERNSLRGEISSYKADATAARDIREYLVANDIAKEDFQLTLDLAAAIRKGDFRAFLEGVTPYVTLAQEALGLRLPQDLQQQVQQGYMTTEAAARFSQERYARQLAEQNAQRQEFVYRQTQAQAQGQQLQTAIQQTVASWEAQVRQSDPDYGRKEPVVRELLWSVVRERGNPQSPQDALAIAQEAYRRADQMVRQFAPKPQATKPTPSSGVQRTGGARPEPKSLMEAAMLGLEQARR